MDRFQSPLTALILVLGAIVLTAMFMSITREGRASYVPELDNPTVLRVYPVPAERAEDIRNALSSAMAGGSKQEPHGRVTLSGTNQLVVLAPLQTHTSVAKAIENLGGGKAAAPASDASVRLTVWLVDATAGAGSDDPALAALAPVLEAARPALGGVAFRLVDTVSVSTMPNGGEASVMSGLQTRLRAELRPINDGVQARLAIVGKGLGSIETTAALPYGRTIVLAQLAAPTEGPQAPVRLYIVRAEPAAG